MQRPGSRYRIILASALALAMGALPAGAADFDGNGYADLAVGVQGEDVGEIGEAGAVNVLYGGAGGISAAGNQIWDQDDLPPADPSETDDRFGLSLAAGDFDGDGKADLVVGVPFEGVAGGTRAGAFRLLYGTSPAGLRAVRSQVWHQDTAGVEGAAEADDWFGWALAVADFDGDGHDDLAAGVPQEHIGDVANAGAVNVLYGTASGIAAAGNQIWYEGHAGLGDAPETGDIFGFALAAADFNGDRRADLAVGLPGQRVNDRIGAGRVAVLYGEPGGLRAAGCQRWSPGEGGIQGSAARDDGFGRVLAAGDFNRDGYADLAAAAPGEDVGGQEDAGAVHILYGSASGLVAMGNQLWHDSGVEAGDKFGWALATGDFNGDGSDELAVGIPQEDVGSVADAGAVQLLYGSQTGLRRRPDNDLWHQDRSGMEDSLEAGDQFGYALAAGDFDADRFADLAIGILREDIVVDLVVKSGAGAVQVLYGNSGGISAVGNRFWHQGSPGIEGGVETGDLFGGALVALPPARILVRLPALRR